MNSITGIIEQVGSKERKTRFGMKPAYSLKIDGQWYNCGFTNPRVTDGTEVSFNYTDGAYGKDIDMASFAHSAKASVPARPTTTGTAPRPPAAGFSGGGKGVFPIPPLDGQRAIVRQNSLTNAVNALKDNKAFNATAPEAADTIIALARKFEAYSCGDLDMLQAKAMLEKEAAE